MDDIKLERANVLRKIIKTTKEGLQDLELFKSNTEKEHKKRKSENPYDDGLYSITIGRHSDNSGDGTILTRYGGNMEILNIIIETLKKQLLDYLIEYKEL